MTRVRMSRPNSSVPKGWARLGGWKRRRIWSLTGSSGASTGAATATSAKPTMMTSPSNVVRTVSSWRTVASRYRRPGRAVASPRSLTSPCAPVTTLIADSSIPDARIDRDVGDVGEEIDDQVDDRRDEDRSLGDRCVAVADPLDRKLTHPRVREDV